MPRDPHGAAQKGLARAKTLPEYMLLVQERTAAAQAARVLGRRYLRVNYTEAETPHFLISTSPMIAHASRCSTRPRPQRPRRTGSIGPSSTRMLNKSIARPIRC